VILLWFHSGGDGRRQAVRPDHHPCVLRDDLAALAEAANAGYPAAVGEEFLDGESFADFGARCGCRVDQQLIQDGSPWRIGNRRVLSARRARYGERAEVERVAADRRALGRQELAEQSPPVQRGNPGRLNDMGRDRVAGKVARSTRRTR
jgi:hypothetical protein